MKRMNARKRLEMFLREWEGVVDADPNGTTCQCNARRVALWMRAGVAPAWADETQAIRFRAFCEAHNIKTTASQKEQRRTFRELHFCNPTATAPVLEGNQLEMDLRND